MAIRRSCQGVGSWALRCQGRTAPAVGQGKGECLVFIRWTTLVIIALCVVNPAPALTPFTTLVVPAAARGAGAGTSMWQMNLYLINFGTKNANVELYWLERNTDNSDATPVTVTVPAGQTLVLADVIRDTFGLEAGGGAIRIESDVPIAATSRIYNLQEQKIYGQGFAGLTTAEAVTACYDTVIGGLRQDASARSNLFAVAGPAGAAFTVNARAPTGLALGSPQDYAADPWSALYIPLGSVAGASAGQMVTAISVTSGAAWFAGSRINEVSGDPLTLAAVTPDSSLQDLYALGGTYAGNWIMQGTSEGVDGTAVLIVTIDKASGIGSIMIDFAGPLVNGVDPGPLTVSGPLGPGGGSFHGVSPEFGSVGSTVDAHGALSWAAAGSSDPDVISIEAAGFVTWEQIIMSFRVTLAGELPPLAGGLALSRQGM